MNRTSLALEVSHILGLPIYHRHDKASEIVNTIIRAMVDALWRGERVAIQGFGIFSVRERPPKNNYCYYFPYLKKKGLHWEINKLPAKRYVHFAPSKVLLRMLNDNDR